MSTDTRALAVSVPARRQGGFPIPLVGMLLFISSEVMFFGGLFAAYFSARASFAGTWGPPQGAEPLEILPIAVALIAFAPIGAGPARGHGRPALHPPAGVHVPPGSWLPVLWAVGGGLL